MAERITISDQTEDGDMSQDQLLLTLYMILISFNDNDNIPYIVINDNDNIPHPPCSDLTKIENPSCVEM